MLSKSRTPLVCAVFGALLAIGLSNAAFAQTTTPAPAAKTPAPAAKPAPAPAANAKTGAAAGATADAAAPPAGAAWAKLCVPDPQNKKQLCNTHAEQRDGQGNIIASVSIQKQSDQDKYALGLVVPMYVYLPAGINLLVDGAKKASAVYSACLPIQPPACIAEGPAENALLDSLKKGKVLSLQLVVLGANSERKEVKLDFALNGFGPVLDSAGLDPQAAAAQQDELNAALQKRAEERRQKLIDQQNKATPASAQ